MNVEGLLGVDTAPPPNGFGAAVAGFPKLKPAVVVVGVGAAEPNEKPEELGRGTSRTPVDFEGPKEKGALTAGAFVVGVGVADVPNENGLFSSAGFAGEKGLGGADVPKLKGDNGVGTAGEGAAPLKRVDPAVLLNAKLNVGLFSPLV